MPQPSKILMTEDEVKVLIVKAMNFVIESVRAAHEIELVNVNNADGWFEKNKPKQKI